MYIMQTKALLAWGSILLSVSLGYACCTAYGDSPIQLAAEKAIIVWDASSKTEHFIRQADFQGAAKEFGFIVPTPSQPDVVKVSDEVFDRLASMEPAPSGGMGCAAEDAATGAASLDSVEVLDVIDLGDYTATILKATNGQAMLDWLRKNAFKTRPAMTDWLDHYAKKNWVFTALKYKGAKDKEIRTKTIRISFNTDKPHYPYKMPADTWPQGHARPLHLFVITNGPAIADYEDDRDKWEASLEWDKPLNEDEINKVATDLNLPAAELPRNSHLTVFRNSVNKHGYDRDLVFTSAFVMPAYAWWGIGIASFAGAMAFRRSRRKQLVRQ